MSGSPYSDLVESVAAASDPGERIVELVMDETRTADPLLAYLLQVSAVPRKFDEHLLAALIGRRQDEREFRDAAQSLLSMPFVIRRHDGLFRIHDGMRATLLSRLEETSEGKRLAREVNERLTAWYEAEHASARETAHQFDSVAGLLWQVSPDRMVPLQSAVEKQLVRPLIEAMHHATAADSANAGLAHFEKWFELYRGEGRVGICGLLLRSWHSNLERLPRPGVGVSQEWYQYYQARLALAEGDRATARATAKILLARANLMPKIRVLSRELLIDSLIEDCRLREALDQVAGALNLRDGDDLDRAARSRVFAQQARINQMLYDGAAKAVSLADAICAARDAGNRESEAANLSELSAHHSAEGDLVGAADSALQALHIVRTFGSRDVMMAAKRCSSRLMRTFGARDPRLADLFHIEATHLIPGDDFRGTLEVDSAYVLTLIRTSQYERAHRVLDLLESRIADKWIAKQADVQILRANLLDAEGREKEAVQRNIRTAEELERDHGNVWNRAAALTNAASTEMDFGDLLDGASAAASEAAKLWESMGHSRGLTLTNVILAEVCRRRADYTAASEKLGSSLPVPAMGLEDLWYRVAARVADDLGHHDKASDYLRHLLDSSRRRGQLRAAARTCALLIELLIRAGRLDSATDQAGAFAEIIDEMREQRRYQQSDASYYADEHNGRGVRLLSTEIRHLHDPIRSAIQHFEEAINSDSGPFWYSLNQAYAFWRLGNRGGALRAIDAAGAKAEGTSFESAINRLSREFVQLSWS